MDPAPLAHAATQTVCQFQSLDFWKRRIEICMKKEQSSRMQMDGARKNPLRFCARCTNGTVAPFQRP
jgi:hypothetical protein